MICIIGFFSNGFQFQDSVCNVRHNFTMLSLKIAVKNVDYCCTIYNISKSEAINLLKISVFKDPVYI